MRQIVDIQDNWTLQLLFEECTHFRKENAGPIESSWCTPGQIGTWAWHQVCPHVECQNLQPSRRIVLSTRLQPCPLVQGGTALGSWGHGKHISGCPQAGAPWEACGQPEMCFPWRTTTRFWWRKQVRKRYYSAHIDFRLNHPCFCSPFLAICWGLPKLFFLVFFSQCLGRAQTIRDFFTRLVHACTLFCWDSVFLPDGAACLSRLALHISRIS